MKRTPVLVFIVVVVLLVTSACFATPPVPPTAPASPPTAVKQAGGKPVSPKAASTATRLIPTDAPSNTMTPFATITPLPTATATGTETPFGFVASLTPTAVISTTPEPPDPDEGATDEWGSATRCSLLSKSLPNWTTVNPGKEYRMTWELLNSGTKTWDSSQMVLVYLDGVKFTSPNHKKTTLPRNVDVGDTINASIPIYTPKLPGHYKAVWGLRMIETDRVFCTFTIKVYVK